jgi:hypothetical protein
MKESVILLIIFLLSFETFSAEYLSSHKVSFQRESGFKISREVAQRILATYQFKSKRRDDFYFQVFDGDSFLLNTLNNLKFRLKVSGDKGEYQVNHKTKTSTISCSSLNFFMKEKEIGESAVRGKELVNLKKQLVALSYSMENPNSSLVTKIKKLDELLLNTKNPLFNKIYQVYTSKESFFVMNRYSMKTKYKYTHHTVDGNIEVSISHGKDFVGKQNTYEDYEIEFQEDSSGPMSVEKYTNHICNFLKKNEIYTKENPVSNTDKLSLEILNEIRDQLF